MKFLRTYEELNNVRKKIYINGFEWWLDINSTPPMIYISEYSKDGFSVYSKHFTIDERKQVLDYIKYGRNEENEKYLNQFEEFKQQLYTVGDTVKLESGGVAKITKINSKNSYMVSVLVDTMYSQDEIEVRENQIIEMVKSNCEPALGTELTLNPSTRPSNDLAINGGMPDTPLQNTLNI